MLCGAAMLPFVKKATPSFCLASRFAVMSLCLWIGKPNNGWGNRGKGLLEYIGKYEPGVEKRQRHQAAS